MKKYRRDNPKHLSNAESSKNRKKKIWIITVLFVMVMSVIGFLSIDFSDDEKYNGFLIVRADSGWKVEIDGKLTDFFYHPAETAGFSLDNHSIRLIDSFNDLGMIYITSPPDDKAKEIIGLVQYDLLQMFNSKNVKMNYAFTKENEFNKPVIDCSNATPYAPVLKFESIAIDLNSTSNMSDLPKFNITSAGSCIEIKSYNPRDFLFAKDLIMYRFYGIVKED